MNESRSSATAIGSAAAAALIGPLTDLVVRAGAAILAVNRAAMRIDGKRDGSPVTEADHAALPGARGRHREIRRWTGNAQSGDDRETLVVPSTL